MGCSTGQRQFNVSIPEKLYLKLKTMYVGRQAALRKVIIEFLEEFVSEEENDKQSQSDSK